MTTDLHGRVALVTGASGGIGSDLALRLAAAGCDVAVHWSGNEAGAQRVADLAAGHGVRTAVLQADLADPAAAAGLVDAAEQRLGPIDVLVPNAGVNLSVGAIEDVALDDWNRTIALNLTAPFLLAQRVVPGMVQRGFGRVLLVSSVAAFTGGIIGPHYTASKAALIGLAHALAAPLAPHGVTVNAVAPALIAQTGMISGDGEEERRAAGRIPVGRFGKPEEVAEAVLMLAANPFVTAQTVSVDGGLYPR